NRPPPTGVARQPPGPLVRAARGSIADAELTKRERDDYRVVDVRIKVVLELECPASRCKLRHADRPVAVRIRDLLLQQPPARGAQLRMVGGDTRRAEPEHRARRGPDRRLAGLGPAPCAVVDRDAGPTSS